MTSARLAIYHYLETNDAGWRVKNVAAPKILIVDDERELVESCARFLGFVSCECLRAFDKAEAIQKIDSHRPNLVVTDLHLPDGSGFEVVRHARSRIPESPIIMMTAYHSPDVQRAAAAAGIVAYLPKPFAMAELGKAVETTLGAICFPPRI